MELRRPFSSLALRTLPLAALAALGSCQVISIDSDHEFVGISHKGPLGSLSSNSDQSVEVRINSMTVRTPNKQRHTHFMVTAFQDENGNLVVDDDEVSSVVKAFQADWSAFEVGSFDFRLPKPLFGEHLAIRVDLWNAEGKPLANTASLIGPTHSGTD